MQQGPHKPHNKPALDKGWLERERPQEVEVTDDNLGEQDTQDPSTPLVFDDTPDDLSKMSEPTDMPPTEEYNEEPIDTRNNHALFDKLFRWFLIGLAIVFALRMIGPVMRLIFRV